MSGEQVPQIDNLVSACGAISPQRILDLSKNTKRHYHKFGIDKGNGKTRWIEAPSKLLKFVQKSVLTDILYQIRPHDAAHGFVPCRSIVTNAQPHVGKEWVANFDIEGFFPATKQKLINQVIDRYEFLTSDERKVLSRIVSKGRRLPQGAPTSPHIANLAMYEADVQLQEYALIHGLSYTRYADDLTFSGRSLPRDLRRFISRVIRPLGYKIAAGKSKWLPRSKRQMVTGLVVNDKISLPRPDRKRLRAILHDARMTGDDALEKAGLMLNQIEGKIALQMMWDEPAARQQLFELREALALHERISNAG